MEYRGLSEEEIKLRLGELRQYYPKEHKEMGEHIDDFALFLYTTGYSHLKKDVINEIQEHLEQCPVCTERFMYEVQNLPSLLREHKEEKREEKDINFVNYQKLSKKGKNRIEKYLGYVGKYLSKLSSGKIGNFYVIVDDEDLLHPGAALKKVPLDFPRGEFRYFSELKNTLLKILEKGKITKKQVLELKLNEEIDEEAFNNSLSFS